MHAHFCSVYFSVPYWREEHGHSGASNPSCTSICSTIVVVIPLTTSWFHCSPANSGMDNPGHEGAAVLFFFYNHAPALDSWHPPSCWRGEEWKFPAGHGRADGGWACAWSEQLRVWTFKYTNTHENNNGPQGDHQQNASNLSNHPWHLPLVPECL